MLGIIDYGAGNIKSVCNALDFIGAQYKIVADISETTDFSGVILPGVGSFGDAVRELETRGFADFIKDYTRQNKPFLGICLGLQLLFEYSAESAGVEGLGVFRGGFEKFPSDLGLKVPHIGWNTLDTAENTVFSNANSKDVYFVHSYYLDNCDKDIIAATTDYGLSFPCAVQRGNVCACQFHPEKSGEVGLDILKSFLQLCNNSEVGG